MQNSVHLGGALSGRAIEGVNMTVSALIKLLFPDPEMETAASMNYPMNSGPRFRSSSTRILMMRCSRDWAYVV